MMFTMPVYDMMLLPGVTFYFKKDIFQQFLRYSNYEKFCALFPMGRIFIPGSTIRRLPRR